MSNSIKNYYDGPKKPQKNIKSEQFNLDFAYSESAAVIDEGIKETIRGVKLSIMAMGIALYRVDVGGYFADLGFRKFGEYIDHLADITGMTRTNLYNWEYIGKAYITYRSDLEKIGFSDDDGATKLPYLGRALENYTKREVFKAIKDMSKREFESWSRGNQIDSTNNYKRIQIKGNEIYVGKSPLVSFADDISPIDRRYYEKLILEAAKAADQNEYAKVYCFYDESEAKQFDKIYQRELKSLRAKK